jgi:hypothetical protein
MMDCCPLNIPLLAASYCLQASSALNYRLPLVIGPTAKLRYVISKNLYSCIVENF